MPSINASTPSRRQYAAYYGQRNLPLALQLYRELMSAHPLAREAEYSRMQVHNIVNAVIPEQQRLDAQLALLPPEFRCDRPNDDVLKPVV